MSLYCFSIVVRGQAEVNRFLSRTYPLDAAEHPSDLIISVKAGTQNFAITMKIGGLVFVGMTVEMQSPASHGPMSKCCVAVRHSETTYVAP